MTEIINSEGEKPKMNYPGNSNKEREKAAGRKDRKVEKVISGEAQLRKKTLGKKIAETFTVDDINSVGSSILFEVIIPEAKSLIVNAATQGIERIFFGASRRISSGSGIVG